MFQKDQTGKGKSSRGWCFGQNNEWNDKRKKLVRMVLRTKDERNGHLENVLDADLKIT